MATPLPPYLSRQQRAHLRDPPVRFQVCAPVLWRAAVRRASFFTGRPTTRAEPGVLVRSTRPGNESNELELGLCLSRAGRPNEDLDSWGRESPLASPSGSSSNPNSNPGGSRGYRYSPIASAPRAHAAPTQPSAKYRTACEISDRLHTAALRVLEDERVLVLYRRTRASGTAEERGTTCT